MQVAAHHPIISRFQSGEAAEASSLRRPLAAR